MVCLVGCATPKKDIPLPLSPDCRFESGTAGYYYKILMLYREEGLEKQLLGKYKTDSVDKILIEKGKKDWYWKWLTTWGLV